MMGRCLAGGLVAFMVLTTPVGARSTIDIDDETGGSAERFNHDGVGVPVDDPSLNESISKPGDRQLVNRTRNEHRISLLALTDTCPSKQSMRLSGIGATS